MLRKPWSGPVAHNALHKANYGADVHKRSRVIPMRGNELFDWRSRWTFDVRRRPLPMLMGMVEPRQRCPVALRGPPAPSPRVWSSLKIFNFRIFFVESAATLWFSLAGESTRSVMHLAWCHYTITFHTIHLNRELYRLEKHKNGKERRMKSASQCSCLFFYLKTCYVITCVKLLRNEMKKHKRITTLKCLEEQWTNNYVKSNVC